MRTLTLNELDSVSWGVGVTITLAQEYKWKRGKYSLLYYP